VVAWVVSPNFLCEVQTRGLGLRTLACQPIISGQSETSLVVSGTNIPNLEGGFKTARTGSGTEGDSILLDRIGEKCRRKIG